MNDIGMAERLRAAAARRMDCSGVINLRRLSGGASQEIWSFDAETPRGVDRLILRRAPGGVAASKRDTSITLETEAELQVRAAAAGVPVPAIRFVLTPEDDLGTGYVMGRLEGETIARKILRDDAFAEARPRLARQCGEMMGHLHGLSIDTLPPLRVFDAAEQVALYASIYRGLDQPHPVFDWALRWLSDRMPEPLPPVLVHGDFRNGNLMIGPEGVRAVLDWELAHLGDGHEDLGWICVNSWRFGEIEKPVGGFGAREDLFAGYEAARGVRVDPERVRFWETFGSLKWGIMCMISCSAHLTGADRSVERAAIGRRSSETEIDLIDLIAGGL